MKRLISIILATIAWVSYAQETVMPIIPPAATLPTPQLRLHNGDFTNPPYTLSIPSPTPMTQAGDSLHGSYATRLNPGFTYKGIAPRPSDYNFPRQYSLNSNYAIGAISTWDNGGIYATSSMNMFPGMGNIGTGSMMLFQDFGRVSLTGSVTGAKYHLDNRLYNSFGVSGQLSYRINDRLTFNAFGGYQQNGGLYHSMATMPYLMRSNYGATMGVQVNDRFSIEMGAQRYYDPYSHKWMTAPILIPQIDINGNKIGVDVGGILFQILHTLISDYTNDYQAPGPMGSPRPQGAPGGKSTFLRKASEIRR